MPVKRETNSKSGEDWLRLVRKYEKYVPVMSENERKELAEGTLRPTKDRRGELEKLLQQRVSSGDMIDRAMERAKQRNKERDKYADKR